MTALTLLRPVVLVGMMGAGKSSAGRKLADQLGLSFYDCDWEIEVRTGMTIRHYFAAHGEAAFRTLEKQVILELANNPPCIIAAGGGTFVQEAIRTPLLEKATVLWLKVTLETLAGRVLGPQLANRPLLANSDDPKSVLARLIEERNPIYSQAHATIEVDGLKVDAVCQKLAETIRQLQGASQ